MTTTKELYVTLLCGMGTGTVLAGSVFCKDLGGAGSVYYLPRNQSLLTFVRKIGPVL